MRGLGAVIFLVVFFVSIAVTLANTSIPPGQQFYNMLNIPITDYLVLGIAATTLIIAVFNGVFYGVIAWLVYTIANRIGIIK